MCRYEITVKEEIVCMFCSELHQKGELVGEFRTLFGSLNVWYESFTIYLDRKILYEVNPLQTFLGF